MNSKPYFSCYRPRTIRIVLRLLTIDVVDQDKNLFCNMTTSIIGTLMKKYAVARIIFSEFYLKHTRMEGDNKLSI